MAPSPTSPDFGSIGSPAFSGSFSPWTGRSPLGSEDFDELGPLYLPESALIDEDEALVFNFRAAVADSMGAEFKHAEPEFNLAYPEFKACWSSELEFKLTGIEDLQNSLASLLANVVKTPTTDTVSTCAPSTPGVEELSRPSTPELQEAVSVPEVAQKKGWGTSPATQSCKEVQLEGACQTSVMVQNFPKKCTRDLLAKTLDEAGFHGNYDLIYVTADLKQRNCGSGSALVNFRSEEACANFTAAFNKTGVAVAFPGFVGKKAIEVVPAPVQGLDANVRKLEKSGVLMSMLAERPGWRPARYNDDGQIEAEIGDC